MSINFEKVPQYIRREIDPPKKLIKAGKRGRTVRQIQEWLCFHECRTGIDEDFGPATRACIMDFQALKNFDVTGDVDNETWNALVQPMREALVMPAGISNMSPAEAVFAVAEQHVGRHPVEIGGGNKGPWVRLYCEGHHGSAWAWCAGFVTMVMQQAYFYLDKTPPIKGSVSCDILASQAQKAGLFVAGREIANGDVKFADLCKSSIFLRRRTATDWMHTGFAHNGQGEPRDLIFSTIEGNTNDEGSREGYEACRRKRGTSQRKYDFIRFE